MKIVTCIIVVILYYLHYSGFAWVIELMKLTFLDIENQECQVMVYQGLLLVPFFKNFPFMEM